MTGPAPDIADITAEWVLSIWAVKPDRAERLARYAQERERHGPEAALMEIGLSIDSRSNYERWYVSARERMGLPPVNPKPRTDYFWPHRYTLGL
jgi:hypothetical protein